MVENLFVRINNKKAFILNEIESINPSSGRYIKYWRDIKKKCIEGLWAQDTTNPNEKGMWRWMPPNLFFYINLGTIKHRPPHLPKTHPKIKMRPDLTDFDWEFMYNYMECRGFSGFDEDDEYSCDLELNDYLNNKDTELNIAELHSSVFNKKGELKKYTPAKEYLRKLHNKPLGRAFYNNEAKNLFLLSARGVGKSYIVAVGCILWEIVFDGARYYNDESILNPATVEVFVGAALSSKSSDILSKAEDAMRELPGSWGVGTDSYEPSPLYKSMKGTLSPNNMKNPWRHAYDKKVNGQWIEDGTGSNIKHGIYTTENPEVAVGTRPGLMVVEEIGLVENILQCHAANESCQFTDGTVKFGTSVYIGTGGNIEKIQGSETIFRDPSAYNCLAFEDVWENTGEIGWFVPAEYADRSCKDENGNTIITKATRVYDKRREEKSKANSSVALNVEMMSFPRKPSEIFLSANSNDFPLAMLREQLSEIETKKHKYENTSWLGELVPTANGTVKFVNGDRSKLITEYPIKDNKNKPGIIQIWEMPKKDSSGDVISGRYLMAADTYDDDESNTKSLGSLFVLDGYTDRIVAEFFGRPSAEDFFNIACNLSLFYRAVNNYEQNKKGMFGQYKKRNLLHYLAEVPQVLKDVADLSTFKVGNKKYGTYATVPVIKYGERLIKSWLEKPAYGEEEDSGILNLHKIRSAGLLRELLSYGSGNFDRVSSLLLLMIQREEMFGQFENKSIKEENSNEEVEDLLQRFKSTNQFSYNPVNYNRNFFSKFEN